LTNWAYNSIEVAILRLPFCIQGEGKVVRLSLTLDTALHNCFLYTDTFIGILSAKLASQNTYMSVGVYSITPSCYFGSLGDIISTVDIDLKIDFTTDYIGEQIVPVYLGFGDRISFINPAENPSWDSLPFYFDWSSAS